MSAKDFPTLGLGILLGLGAAIWLFTPSGPPSACPTGFDGIPICPREWQTLIAGFLAIIAGLAVYFAAKLKEDREDRRLLFQKWNKTREDCQSLEAEFRAIAERAKSAANVMKGEFEKQKGLDFETAVRLSKDLSEVGGNWRDLAATLQHAKIKRNAITFFHNARIIKEHIQELRAKFGKFGAIPNEAIPGTQALFDDLAKEGSGLGDTLQEYLSEIDRRYKSAMEG